MLMVHAVDIYRKQMHCKACTIGQDALHYFPQLSSLDGRISFHTSVVAFRVDLVQTRVSDFIPAVESFMYPVCSS